ncbi:helicase associated domain-containing protein [Desulfoluna sp.]|uniref:helicase associated domain-containing protein n=1 Tax=Desulfoluna sp. TaxID=2045199 RepID=UPI0026054B01|nr:helicase associated domain-containing protein [Desulfoluna sp.]
MRELRLMLEGEVALYAISNEIALDLPDLSLEAQEELVELMADAAEYCGVERLCWHVTPRGYGALVRVYPPGEVDEAELSRRVALWYGDDAAEALVSAGVKERKKFVSLSKGYLKKMHSILEYARLFQPRFSRYSNRQHGRRGLVWRQRFRSYLLEDSPEVRTRFAGYLHTRPHGEPDTGVFSSLFLADSGDSSCRKAYRELTGMRSWESARSCLGEAVAEMAARVVRPSCGEVDDKKIESARKRSRRRQKKALLTDAAWMGFYDAYQTFVATNGSARFPKNAPHYDGLRYWVQMQRTYLKRGRLGTRRRELLESISFPVYVNGQRAPGDESPHAV